MPEFSYVKRWKNWINRKKVFSQDELNELETYLIDKMETLQEKDGLSEKESFQQALDSMGESGLLNEEYTKIRRSPFDKVKWWAFVQTVVSVLLVVYMIGSSFQQDKNQAFLPDERIFNDCGWVNIPREFRLSDSFKLDNELYFLDHYSSNFVLINLTKSISKSDKNPEYHFQFKGTLFAETILKDPTSLFQDEDSTVYILEISNAIRPTGMNIRLIGSNEKIPFHIMKLNQKGELKEYSNIHLKISEIEIAEDPQKIGIWGKYLVISFFRRDTHNLYSDRICKILLIDKTSLEKTIFEYKILPLQSNALDFNIYDNKLWLLYCDRIDWYSIENNAEPIKEGTMALTNSISDDTKLFQHESYQDFILFDRDKNEIHLINKETHLTKVHKATGITNLHIFNEKEISGIFSFVDPDGQYDYFAHFLYQLKTCQLNESSK